MKEYGPTVKMKCNVICLMFSVLKSFGCFSALWIEYVNTVFLPCDTV